MSAGAKAKISAAAKARWAKVHAKNPPAKATDKTTGVRRKMDSATRKRISDAMKASWAKKQAPKK